MIAQDREPLPQLLVYADAPNSYEVYPHGVHITRPTNMAVQFHTCHMAREEANSFLSIRCAFGGQRVFEVDQGRFAVDDASYFLLNPGTKGASSIYSDSVVESFSIFFWPGIVERVLASLVMPTDHLLENPLASVASSVIFFERVYPHDDLLSPLLFQLRNEVGREEISYGWREEQFHRLLERMLLVHRKVGKEIERLPAVRAATRAELYRRLYRARDFIDASLGQTVTLHEMAEVAWLSPYHFLRLFKLSFGETPHQYLTRRRLERAQTWLLTTEMSVTEICMESGFQSMGSFSWLFRREKGLSPEQFRREYGKRISKG